ncbi:MAG: hypothetical protein LBL85_04090 [Methanocalculaceae archaeon]|jgi:hypothetical protein|nr:hypothetical protein [Methanocalculaceae archaeon]
MKIPVAAGVLAVLILTVFSAGCIGDQTTDIMFDNQSIGKITITPVYENMFSNSSLEEKFNVRLELFGMEFSRNGVTRAEADNISAGILDGSGGLNMSFINSSGLVTPDPDSAGTNLTSFMDEVFNMPLTNRDRNTTINDIDWNGAFTRMQESLDRLSGLLNLSGT